MTRAIARYLVGMSVAAALVAPMLVGAQTPEQSRARLLYLHRGDAVELGADASDGNYFVSVFPSTGGSFLEDPALDDSLLASALK